MSERILTVKNEYNQLSERSEEIDVRKEGTVLRETILKLKDTIRANKLTSLSAPQIGVQKRIIVVKFKDDLRTFVNPLTTAVEGFGLSREKCPSIPGKYFIRPRNTSITVMYQNPMGKIITQKFPGLAAAIIQEEIDHLDGLLLSDVGLEVGEDFDNASEEERNQVIDAYLESLDIKKKNIQKEVEEDTDLQQIQKGLEFEEAVRKGEVRLEKGLKLEVVKEE